MKRSIAIAICGLLVAMAAYAPKLINAKPAHAISGCLWTDFENTIYPDWYASVSTPTYDSWDGLTKNIFTDIRTFRYNGGNGIGQSGHCYRGYYSSVWTGDGTGCYCRPMMRVWVCGVYAGQWDGGIVWSNRNDVVTRSSSAAFTLLTHLDSGQDKLVDYYDYQGGPACLPQQDNNSSTAWSPTWNFFPQANAGPPPNYWYCHDRGHPIYGPGYYCYPQA